MPLLRPFLSDSRKHRKESIFLKKAQCRLDSDNVRYTQLRFQIWASEKHSSTTYPSHEAFFTFRAFSLFTKSVNDLPNYRFETHQDWWTSRPHQHRRARCRCPASTSWRPSRWAASRPPRPAAAACPGICTVKGMVSWARVADPPPKTHENVRVWIYLDQSLKKSMCSTPVQKTRQNCDGKSANISRQRNLRTGGFLTHVSTAIEWVI